MRWTFNDYVGLQGRGIQESLEETAILRKNILEGHQLSQHLYSTTDHYLKPPELEYSLNPFKDAIVNSKT